MTVKTILNKTNDQVYQFLLGEVLRPDGFTQTIEFPINKNITIYCVAPKWQEEKGESYRERYHKAWLNLTDFIVNITMRCIADVYQGHPLYIDRDAKLEKIGTFLGAAIKNKHVAETEVPFANIKQRPEKAHVSANQSASTSAIDNPLVSINTTLFTVETTGKHCLSIKLIDEPKSVTSEPEAYIISSSYNGLLCCSSENKEVTGLCNLEVMTNATDEKIRLTKAKLEQDYTTTLNTNSEYTPKNKLRFLNNIEQKFYENIFTDIEFKHENIFNRVDQLAQLISKLMQHDSAHYFLSIDKQSLPTTYIEKLETIQSLISTHRKLATLTSKITIYGIDHGGELKDEDANAKFDFSPLPQKENVKDPAKIDQQEKLCFKTGLDDISVDEIHNHINSNSKENGKESVILIDLSEKKKSSKFDDSDEYFDKFGKHLLSQNTNDITRNTIHFIIIILKDNFNNWTPENSPHLNYSEANQK